MRKKYIFNLSLITVCLAFLIANSVKAQSLPTLLPVRAVTTAETDAANPDTLDANNADIQVLKTADGSGDRESYLKFNISSVRTENLSFVSFRATGGQHNDDNPLITPYIIDIYACQETDWSRNDLTWNSAQGFTIGEQPLASTNIQGFGAYDFYSAALRDYIIAQKNDGADYVAFKVLARNVHEWDSWITGSWSGGASELYFSYSEPYKVLPSVTTAETDAANPEEVDAVVDDANDVQVLKTAGGSADREAYVKFDVSEVNHEYLKHAVISCYGGQHNGDESMIEANWVQVYACNDTNWSRENLTWNMASDFTIGDAPLAYANIQDFATYEFSSPAIADYIIEQKTAGAKSVAFKFVARDEHAFDSWLSGAWEGMNLSLYQGDRNFEPVQDLETGDTYAGSPALSDTVPNDIMVQATANGAGDIEGFVSFDLSGTYLPEDEEPGLVYASIAFRAGQHVPEGQDPLDKFTVGLYPVQSTDWTQETLDWNTAANFPAYQAPVATVNIWGYGDYIFTSDELAGYINSQLADGNTTLAFKMAALDNTSWDAWLSGDWYGMHLDVVDPDNALPADTEAPTVPGNLKAISGITTISLSWENSTDNREVGGYKIYSGDTILAIVNADRTGYIVEGLNPENEYSFDIVAFDRAGNESDKASVSVETVKNAFDITIDGEVDEDWDNFTLWEIDNLLGPDFLEPGSKFDASGEFRLAWSPDGLYMYVEVFDNEINTDDYGSAGYQTDHLEVDIDPGNNKTVQSFEDGQMQFSFYPTEEGNIGLWLNGADNTGQDPSLVEFAHVKKATSYVFEAMFPWSALGVVVPPEMNDSIGFEITISDNDAGEQMDGRESVLAWYHEGDYNTWNDPSIWGTLYLQDDGKLSTVGAGSSGIDDTPPELVENIQFTLDCNDVSLSWDQTSDNVGISKYYILDVDANKIDSTDATVTEYKVMDLAPGTYYYTVTAGDSSGNESAINYDEIKEVTVTETDCAVGIENEIMGNAITLYPNPVKEMLFIESTSALNTISVFNLTGRKVLVSKINAMRATIDMSALSPGVYFIRLLQTDGKVYIKKVFK